MNRSKDSYIKFYEKENHRQIFSHKITYDSQNISVVGTKLVFKLKIKLENNKDYYIAFDSGVIHSTQGCKLENERITVSDFWTFSVKDCPNECRNNGTCIGPNQCECKRGWSGLTCENPICNKTCENNGSCIGPNLCKCKEGWNGSTCENPICRNGCENDGKCIKPDTCQCLSGWTGSSCENAICDQKCENNGKCTAPDTCTCAVGWSGKYCEIELKNC